VVQKARFSNAGHSRVENSLTFLFLNQSLLAQVIKEVFLALPATRVDSMLFVAATLLLLSCTPSSLLPRRDCSIISSPLFEGCFAKTFFGNAKTQQFYSTDK
jgi:hypothetical protein